MKVGILGGTFDPIHRGHVHMARSVMEAFALDRVEFMVAHAPPHKKAPDLTSSYHRYAMAVLGLCGEPKMAASPLELERTGVSYTIDTMETLAANNPQVHYCFLAGSDALQEIHFWKDYDKLLSEHCFIFVQRSEKEVSLNQLQWTEEFLGRIRKVSRSTHPKISRGRSFLIHLNALPICATDIRVAIADGKDLAEGVLSPLVLQYIKKHQLYERHP